MSAGGIGFWTFAFPQDLIKSIIQTQSLQRFAAAAPVTPMSSPAAVASVSAPSTSAPLSFLATGRHLVRTEGVARLWRGFPIALFRGVPGAAITFTTYTTVMAHINDSGW